MTNKATFKNQFSKSISNIQIQQNTQHSSQVQINSDSFDYSKASEIIQLIKSEISTFDLPSDKIKEVRDLIEKINANIEHQKSPKVIVDDFSALKNFLTQFGANLASHGAIQLINTVFCDWGIFI